MAAKDKGVDFSHGTMKQTEGMGWETNKGEVHSSVTDEKTGSGAPVIEDKTTMQKKISNKGGGGK